MATFVSLVTCHHCNMTSRHGVLYRDSVTALSKNFICYNHGRKHGTRVRALPAGDRARLIAQKAAVVAKPSQSESAAPPSSKSSSVKSFVFVHLRKLLMLNETQRKRKANLTVFL